LRQAQEKDATVEPWLDEMMERGEKAGFRLSPE
jgi:hypothetical protein